MKAKPKHFLEIESDNMVSEPMVQFQTASYTASMSTWSILGAQSLCKTKPVSDLEYYALGMQGISKNSIENLAKHLDIPMKNMADLLNISYKTISRKLPNERLDSVISSHSIEIAQVVAKGLQVFENEDKFNTWLQRPNRSLDGQKPYDMLKSPLGMRFLMQILGRIQEGVYT